jgi:putative ABC transport system substrate-binding protein
MTPMFVTRFLVLFLLVICQAVVVSPAAAETSVFLVTWRGCEDACRGFKDYLSNLGRNITFTERDAGRDKTALRSILTEVRSAKPDLIVSWGTSVTKGLAGTMDQLDDPAFNHEIPQVFMIVADPVGSGVVKSLDATGRSNVTGTYNRVPETVTIQTIRTILPNFRRLGLLYNVDEPNSIRKKEELASLAESGGFDLVALPIALGDDGVSLAEDIAPKMRALAKAGVEFVYVGSSSFLRANSLLFGATAKDTKLPVLSPYEQMVHEGSALISVAARYYDVGRLAGQQAQAILFEGVQPGELSVLRMTQFAVTLNLGVAKGIGVFPPFSLLQIAETVE